MGKRLKKSEAPLKLPSNLSPFTGCRKMCTKTVLMASELSLLGLKTAQYFADHRLPVWALIFRADRKEISDR